MSNAAELHAWLDSSSSKAPDSDCYDTGSMPSIDFECEDYEKCEDSNSNDTHKTRSKNSGVRALHTIDILDVLSYASDLTYQLCALAKYIKPDDTDSISFNNKVDELIDLLHDPPKSTGLNYIPDYRSMMQNAIELKNALNKLRGL